MTQRYGSSLINGAQVYGDPGLGVTGAVIRATTATGANGAGLLYNDWDAGDDAKEFRALIVTPPSAGTFLAYEDGSFSLASAPDGSYSIVYRLFADGVDLGVATAIVYVGAGTLVNLSSNESQLDGFASIVRLATVSTGTATELGQDTSAGTAAAQVSATLVALEMGPDVVAAQMAGVVANLVANLFSGELSLDTAVALTSTAISGSMATLEPAAADLVLAIGYVELLPGQIPAASRRPVLVTTPRQQTSRLSFRATPVAPKDPEEVDYLPFDFGREMTPGEVIVSVEMSVQVSRGVDPDSAAMLAGLPARSGGTVTQRIAGGVSGAVYTLRCKATTSTGRTLVAAASLPVVTL